MFNLPNLSSKSLLLGSASLAALLITAPANATTFTSMTGRGTAQVTGNAAPRPAGFGAASTPGQAATATAQSAADFSTALARIQAQMSAQAAMRSAPVAATVNVPDGLTAGGLVVDPRVGIDPNLWVNANAPTQAASGAQTTVTVQQTAQRAITTWQSFNVGKNTTVHIDQTGGNSANGNNWTMLARVDATGTPSQIQGQINAEGTVLLINPNGIVFGGSSQVNVHSLVASSLDVNGYQNNNVGVFDAHSTYNPIAVNGVTQTQNGQVIIAPTNEDSANQTFLTSGLFINNTINVAGTSGQAFFAGPSNSQAGANAGVQVQAGAQINAAVSGTDNGGFIALLGPQVSNAGSILAPSGQIILAAGNNLGLSNPASGGINLAVVPGAELATSSQVLAWTAANSLGSLGALAANADGGLLSSHRGNVTLFGDTVQQLGAIDVTTSITRTGSITLRAIGQNLSATAPGSWLGSVVFGPDSVTAILPEENGETIPTNSVSSFTTPSITVQNAANVDVQSGSLIEAPGAAFSISGSYVQPFSATGSIPSGRVFLEAGSTIDLAGTNATVPLSSYLYTFKVTANDIAGTPLAQNLIGTTVTIDLSQSGTRSDGEAWVGSPLFASSGAGYLGDIPQTIDQLLSKGGSFTVAKGGGFTNFADVIQAPGSLINVSGGWIAQTGGSVTTTNLMGADGRIYNIADANPFIPYSGFAGFFALSHPRWAITDTYTNALVNLADYRPDDIVGLSAGSINLTAANPILEGAILGDTVTGWNQRSQAQIPSGASLTINLAGGAIADEVLLADTAPEQLPDGFDFLNTPFLNAANAQGSLPTDAFNLPVITYSTSALSAEGLGSITIKGASLLSMAQGARLTVRDGGSVTLNDATTIDGTITAHGGTIAIAGFTPTATTSNGNPTAYVFPVAYENLVLGADAKLDVSGLWVNDTGAGAGTLLGKAFINGGTVSLNTYAVSHPVSTTTTNAITTVDAADGTASIILDARSVIDVSSGGYVNTKGQLATASNGLPLGVGGNLSFVTYSNVGWASNTMASSLYESDINNFAPFAPNAANVVMDGTIQVGGLSGGGSFTLQAPTIVIDGAASGITSATSGDAAGTITLPTSLFQGGFSNYNLTSTYGSVTVTPGTTVRVEQQTWQLGAGRALPASGAALQDFATLGFALDGLRPAASLSLTEQPFAFGTAGDPSTTAGVILGTAASIVTDPGASVTLVSGRALDVLGSITDHGGAITLAGAQDTWIGSKAIIDVSGTFIPNPSVTTYQTGTELAGGSITFGLAVNQIQYPLGYTGNGAVIIQSGAVLDLSGGKATVEAPAGLRGSSGGATQTLWSDGGTLTFNGSGNLYLGGTINAAGGAPSAAGGTIKIGNITASSLLNGVIDAPYAGIVVTDGGDPSAPFGGASLPATQSDLTALLTQAGAASGTAYVTADTLSKSGFSTVVLNAGQILFPGSVTVSGIGELDLVGMPVLPTHGSAIVNLDANYIRLVGYVPEAPTLGDGTLNLNATSQIDIEGDVSVLGASNVNLASGGDIRLIWSDGSVLSAPLVTFPIQADGSTVAAPALSTTSLNVADSLTLTAREVYVATGTNGALLSLGLGSNNTITIASNGAAPSTPLSAGGSLLVGAPTIVQNGALYAPLGTIQLGVSASEPVPAGFSLVAAAPVTNSVTLGDGSLTSVSIAGLDLPYGFTINGAWQSATLPQKQVILAGADVATNTGAVLDLSGGGDVYATEFVAGTGGSRNVLTTPSQTVHALVPGYASDVAAAYPTGGYNLTSWGSAGKDSATAFSLKPGMTVTLPGGNGIAAGTYTLMPAMYATMPGAYRVVVASANANPNAPVSSVTTDGTVTTTGVFGNAITGETSSQTALLQIQSQAVWSKYSEIDISSANSAFTTTAQQNGLVIPRLPIDAGQLILAATASLNLNATNNFAAGSAKDASGNTLTGRGGLADITGSDLLVVAADEAAAYAAHPAYDGATVLDADQLSHLGVASLLIGGVRTPSTTGVSITPAATSLTVATDAAHPLSTPDLILATTGAITHTSATTQVNAATGAQTVTIAAGLSGIAAGQGIVLYDASNIGRGSALNWVQGTVTAYDPTTGSLTIAGASANGTGQISNATVLIAAPSLGSGLAVTDGSVVKAVGTVPAGSSQNIIVGANPTVTGTNNSTGAVTSYIPGVSGDGALLRVSNGEDITVNRAFVPGSYNASAQPTAFAPVSAAPEGQLSVGAATIQGSAITLDSSGTNVLAPDAVLAASHYTLSGNLINLGGTNAAGLTLSPDALARFAGAQSVVLHSYSVFNLYGDETFGSAAAPITSLTFDGSGFYSDGGTVSIAAGNVIFQDSQPTPSSAGANTTGAGGTLNVSASDTITVGQGAQTWGGFGQATLNGATEVLFSGSGSLNAGASNVTLTTPALVADTGAAQSLITTGTLNLVPTGSDLPTLPSTMLGGTLALTGGAINVSNAILAPGGAITLDATGGDLTIASGAQVAARGSRVTLFGFNEDVAAGTVKLIADTGNVTLASGSTIDVSAAGDGYAGTLSISAANGTATLGGALLGSAAYKDLGGTFILNANRLSGSLPLGASFSGVYAVTLGQGDILVDAGQTISSGTIQLVANNGSVTVNGTLDASGPTGGNIALYGAGANNGSTVSGGVTIGSAAQLIARYAADDAADPANGNGTAALVQNGGTIILGTSGIGSTTNLDPVEGYEIVLPTQSGSIAVASGATFDVSGGPGGPNISNTGGAVYLRAPIVENADGSNRSVNVTFNGTLITNAGPDGRPSGKGLVLEPYAVWSTADSQTDTTKYFDGIIDPAGWYSAGGTLIAGTFKDAAGNLISTWSGSSAPSLSSVASTIFNATLGTQALTVQPGLNYQPGDSVAIMRGATSAIVGTVVAYDSVTGALVLNITKKVGNGVFSATGAVVVAASGIMSTGIFTYPINGFPQAVDANGNTYFSIDAARGVTGQSFAPGTTFILFAFAIDGSGTTYQYAATLKSLDASGMQFYSPQLLAAQSTFGVNPPYAQFFSFGASAPLTTTTAQPFKIGTGLKALTIPASQSYVAGEPVTLTDSRTTTNTMTGTVQSYNATTGALVLNVTSATGTGVTASGNWTFAVSLTPDIVSSFLTNDYFEPTSTNTAHQTFYGLNPANGAAGTLMGFVQNPFNGNDATALSGLSGASVQIGASGSATSASSAAMLHVSPEIDLVNPSSSVNGGDISVLTNWNLGAGVAGPDGNPASLYFRDNGWAPTITLRAVADINLDASITDGFFQKLPTVGGHTPTNAASSTLATVMALANYRAATVTDANAIKTNPTATSKFGALAPTDLTPYLARLPQQYSGSDTYYTAYTSYLAAYTNYYNNALSWDYGLYKATGKAPTQAVTDALALANAAYSSTNLAAYAAYVVAYGKYVTAWNSFSSSGTFSTLPVPPNPPPAISAAPGNNQPIVNNGPAPIRTAYDQSPIANMDLVSEASSSSYRFVAGAQFNPDGITSPVNPEAAVSTGASDATDRGDVTLSGHISYSNTAYALPVSIGSPNYNPRVDVPTIIRTGTGSIDMVASGDIEWLDALSPAALYTAGTVAPNADDFNVPALPANYTSGQSVNGFATTPTWATGGGALTLSAGQDIIGIETPVDSEMMATTTGSVDAQTLGSNSPSMAQFWSPWYIPLGQTTGQAATPFATSAGGVQNSAYINYATFFQGVGALGGGNVTVNSGRNTYDLSVSLPETIQVSGGRFTGDSAPAAHYYGGGDLSVTVGNNLYSSDFYVGRGAGTVRVTGSVLTDPANPIIGQSTGVHNSLADGNGIPTAQTSALNFTPVPLLLAEQDGYITVQAGGSLALGGVFEPTRIPAAGYPYHTAALMPSGYGSGFDSYGVNSGVTLMSAGGDVTLVDALPQTLDSANQTPPLSTTPSNLLPATLQVISVAGDLSIGNNKAFNAAYRLYPSAQGNLVLAAGGTLSTAFTSSSGGNLTLNLDSIGMTDATSFGDVSLYSILGTPTPTTLPAPLHADDPNPALILAGQDIIGSFKLIKSAKVQAGRDILDTAFTGQNNNAGDVTSIIAGRDIRSTNVVDGVTYGFLTSAPTPGIGATAAGGDTVLELYGPGQFEVAAGRNLGPFLANPYSDTGGGIFAVGNGSNIGTLKSAQGVALSTVVPYLPVQGADITTLFGVGNGVDYGAAVAAYVDPAGHGGAQGVDYLPEIAGYMGLAPDAAWTAFQKLPAARQQLLVDRAFLDFLTQVATDYRNPASPYFDQYARAYDTIATLFPAGSGYTNNNTGESNGASATVHTGDLLMARSRIETQTGGDINILGPGGGITVGYNQADTISPNQEGILTLQGGSVRAYVDDDVQVFQSRIFTEQGGDVDLFSANGDLNAGKGPKSSAAYPPLQLICDTDGYCRVSPAGLVTGAGIGALLTIPGQDPSKSNASLTAPHGTVDAGAAGIRVAGDLNILALQVLNAFNIDVGGKSFGLPPIPVTNLTLTTASTAATEAASIANNLKAQQPATTVDVEVTGFGGEDFNNPQECRATNGNGCGSRNR